MAKAFTAKTVARAAVRADTPHSPPVLNVTANQILEPQRLGPAMVDGQGIHRETRFERRVLIQVVDDHLRQGIPLDLDDDARVLIRLVAHGGDVCNDLLVYEVGDPLHQHGAVNVERNLGDNNLLAPAFKLLEADLPDRKSTRLNS